MKSNLQAIDLFSGCGGLSQGLKTAGFNVIGAVEIDDKARETYTLNHPSVPLIGKDICQLTIAQIKKATGLKVGELDMLAGCPPCQGFSALKRRNKKIDKKDPRNSLIDEFERLAFGLMPKLIMLENVPAIESFQKFKSFVIKLKKNGYLVRHEVLDVSNYGVPQRRRRLILSASRVGQPLLASPHKHKISVEQAIGKLSKAGHSNDLLHDHLTSKRTARIQQLIEAIPKDGGSRHSLPLNMQLECHKKTSGFNDVYGRMSWNDVAPTITSGCTNPSKGRFLHPQENRAITLREAAILQGFPASYSFNVAHGKSAISLMIGNALPPPFIAAHSKAMAKGLQDE